MKQVMIFIGTGGVGKTTLAAATAVREAKAGRNVLVLTIDPSRRLAITLGLQEGQDLAAVPGANFSGKLWAGLVDHQKTFDEFVMKAANKAPGAEKLLHNRLYRQLSTSLSGSQDFTALLKLLTCYEEMDFDLIILDTPPSQHLNDFLQAPAKIAALFNEGVSRWFRQPDAAETGFFRRIVSGGTKQVLKILESLTGSEFIRELGDFFAHIESWQGRLTEKTSAVHRLLVDEKTEFHLVTGVDRAKLTEATDFARHIRQGGYGLRRVLINRARPEWLRPPEPQFKERSDLKQLFEQNKHFQAEREAQIDAFATGLRGTVEIARLPELIDPVQNLKDLEAFSVKIGGES